MHRLSKMHLPNISISVIKYLTECHFPRPPKLLDSFEESGAMKFYKQKRGDSIWWVDTSESHGLWLFSFDKKQVYNMFTDYPNKLTPEQKAIFDKENPFWANFFKDL